MMDCVVNARTSRYLPKTIAQAKQNFETDSFHYDHTTNSLNCKLLTQNPFLSYFQQIYPTEINENQLTNDMLDVLKSYTDSKNNECYMKTNLNLLSSNFDEIDWIYVNKLRCLLRGLTKTNFQHSYYRGLTLSDQEITYYLEKRNECYYTNSFTSLTTDRQLIYEGNAILILRIDNSSEEAKKNLANICRWSQFREEKEVLLAVGSRLKILSVHFYGCKWEIEVELIDE